MSLEMIRFYNTLLALLALFALALSLGLVIYRLVKGADVAASLGPTALWMAWAVAAAVATVGSLVYSGVIHFLPCRLCWYQRVAMYRSRSFSWSAPFGGRWS